jgi:predicted CxxxxCH...CXXCH cytochrome family protein
MKLRVWIVMGAAALAACGKGQKVSSAASSAGSCVKCHGGLDNQTGAPPYDLRRNTATTETKVGAHTAHVQQGAGSVAPAFGCEVCHPKPDRPDAPLHGNGTVDLLWNALATGGGKTAPRFDEGSGTCSNVYCHGDFKGGNASNAPVWTQVGTNQAACGSCHGLPPPRSSGHPQRTDCGQCHGGYTDASVNMATHVNGRVDVLSTACTVCHGDDTRGSTALNPQLAAAPPVDTAGLDASPAVGAHQAHLMGGGLRGPIACIECHAVPANLDAHPVGTTTFSWGPIATTGGKSPSYAGAPTRTCSNVYCHGAFPLGNASNAPRWDAGPSGGACGTCHGFPPPAPHVQQYACGNCHPGYNPINRDLHINGQPDLVALDCTTCHGSPGRATTTLNPRLAAAPPQDTRGDTLASAPGVGAHQAHLAGGPLRAELPCTSCHAVPTSNYHENGVTDFEWSTLARGVGTAAGATTVVYDSTSHTCSGVYCHGASLAAGGTQHQPTWTGGAAEAACGTCHAIPPPPSSGHSTSTKCGGCHPGFTQFSVDPATHIDGSITLTDSCTGCHGDSAKTATPAQPLWAAPPTDTNGATVSDRVGAHQPHVQDGGLRSGIACTECHPVPNSLATHPSGSFSMTWGALATGVGTRNGTVSPAPSYTNGACANTYCHGVNLNAGGSNHAPGWSDGAAAATCDSCHGAPPATLADGTTPHLQNTRCGGCHGAAYSYDPTTHRGTVDPARHVDGTIQPVNLNCTSCHGDSTQTASPSAPLWAAPPTDTNGATVSAKVGAHQPHVQDGGLRSGIACTECHPVPTSLTTHPSGSFSMTFGSLAQGVGTRNGAVSPPPSYAGGTCSNTYCHGANLNGGGSNHAPSWSQGAAAATCDSCHGAPPTKLANGVSPHPQNVSCGSCHGAAYSYNPTTHGGTVDPATHVDGSIQVGAMTCTSCHGDATKTATSAAPLYAAPPVDTTGATTSVAVGAHQTHLNGSVLSAPIGCTQCHTVPASLAGHPTGTLDLTWGPLATGAAAQTTSDGYRTISFSSTASPNSPGFASATATCSSTYCHGSYSGSYTYPDTTGTIKNVPFSGNAASPTWGGSAPCGSCHAIPPATGMPWHSGYHGGGNDCSVCHPDATGTTAANARITNASLHANGKVELTPDFTSPNPNCSDCH